MEVMNKIKFFLFSFATLIGVAAMLSSCSSDDDLDSKTDYDVIQINGESYACYGYRCPITYTSDWDLSDHSGYLYLPCGKLSDAQKGEYDYDYMYSIFLEGKQDLKKGSKLEEYSLTFDSVEDWETLDYVSGSATITDKKDDKYIIVKFDSFKFASGNKSYVLNGTVQLDLDED